MSTKAGVLEEAQQQAESAAATLIERKFKEPANLEVRSKAKGCPGLSYISCREAGSQAFNLLPLLPQLSGRASSRASINSNCTHGVLRSTSTYLQRCRAVAVSAVSSSSGGGSRSSRGSNNSSSSSSSSSSSDRSCDSSNNSSKQQ